MAEMKFTFETIHDKYIEDFLKNSVGPNKASPEIIIHPSECVMPAHFTNYIDRIQNFEVYPDDVWIITFPKCGTTWTQEMVWLLKNDLDFKKAKGTSLVNRVPFLELEAILLSDTPHTELILTIDMAKNLTRPRCIKSHLPLDLLPKQLWTVKPKIVYVTRDPRDVVISYYHHKRLWTGYKGTLDSFVDAFLHDRVAYAPFWKHVIDFCEIKDKSHILYNTYEDMKEDLAEVIRKTASFLDVSITDEQIASLKDHLSFKSMQKNDSVNYNDVISKLRKDIDDGGKDETLVFMRKGETGQWKQTLSLETLERFREWNEKFLKNKVCKNYPWVWIDRMMSH